jgi:hypothetical protein
MASSRPEGQNRLPARRDVVIETQPASGFGHDRTRGDAPQLPPDSARQQGPSPSLTALEARRELLEQLQVREVHLQTATALETRAERSVNDTFAAVLRERAADHRRTAARIFENLAVRGHVPNRPRRRR